MLRIFLTALIATGVAIATLEPAIAAPPLNTASVSGPNYQKVCGAQTANCSEKGHGSEVAYGFRSTWSSSSFSSWDELTWSTQGEVSAGPGTGEGVSSGAQSNGPHVKLTVSGAHKNTVTPIHFILTMTGVDATPKADNAPTQLTLQISDNNQENNTGYYHQINGTYDESGFSNVSVEDVGNTTVNFSGDLYVKGRQQDLSFYVLLDQGLSVSNGFGENKNRKAKGSANVTLSITPPPGVQLVREAE